MANKTVVEEIRALTPGESFADIKVKPVCTKTMHEVDEYVKSASARLSTAGGRVLGSGSYKVSQFCTFTADRTCAIYGAVITRIE